MSRLEELPAATVRSETAPTADGPRLGTVAIKPCWTNNPPASEAVTVMVAVPLASPRIRSMLVESETEATAVSELVAP